MRRDNTETAGTFARVTTRPRQLGRILADTIPQATASG
jgi:hypothetical protein